MNIQKLWEQLQTKEEHDELEAKPGNEIGRSVKETISAFSNTIGLGGGVILFGVTEMNEGGKNKYVLTGVKHPEKIQKDLATQCRTNFNVPIRPEIKIEQINGVCIIGVYIPETDPSQKPVYIDALGLHEGSFVRVGPTDQKCTDTDFAKIYAARDSKSYDSHVLDYLSTDNLNPVAISEYRRLRNLVDPTAVELKLENDDLLISLKCAEKVNGVLRPTIAGIILFGNKDVIQKEFPMIRFDYIRMPGTAWNPGSSKSYYTQEMNEGLFTLLPRAEGAIMDDIPRTIRLPQTGLTRDDYPIIPSLVVREALVNAVMHRDYRVNGPTQVIRYADRLEFRNPGHSLKPHPEEGNPGSILRNPIIANVLHETKYAENKGIGITIIMEEMQKVNLSLPIIRSSRENNEFSVTVFVHNLAGEEDIMWLAQFKEFNLSTTEVQILMLLHKNGMIKNADCRQHLQLDTLHVSSILQRLRKLDILEVHGGGGWTYYTLSPKYLTGDFLGSGNKGLVGLKKENKLKNELKEKPPQITLRENNGLNSSKSGNEPNIKLKDIFKTGPGDEFIGLNQSNPLKSEENRLDKSSPERILESSLDYNELLTLLPEHVRHEIKRIPGRVDRESATDAILKICDTGKAFTPNQIAVLIRRNRKWLTPILREMVENGLIAPTIPDNIGSRKQRYHALHAKGQSKLNSYLNKE